MNSSSSTLSWRKSAGQGVATGGRAKIMAGLRPVLPLVVVLLLFWSTSCAGEPARLFRIGTGGQTGVYYPVGKLIAQGLA